jgi:hypothetical protein
MRLLPAKPAAAPPPARPERLGLVSCIQRTNSSRPLRCAASGATPGPERVGQLLDRTKGVARALEEAAGLEDALQKVLIAERKHQAVGMDEIGEIGVGRVQPPIFPMTRGWRLAHVSWRRARRWRAWSDGEGLVDLRSAGPHYATFETWLLRRRPPPRSGRRRERHRRTGRTLGGLPTPSAIPLTPPPDRARRRQVGLERLPTCPTPVSSQLAATTPR